MLKTSKSIRKIIGFIAGVMLIIYAAQVFNNTFYIHTHFLSNGKVVTHAHPYEKAADTQPVNSHHHTMDQLVSLANVELLFPVLFFAIALIIPFSQQAINELLVPVTGSACVIQHKGRAPPLS